MTIEWVEIEKIKPNPKNPNKHSDEQIERLVKMISYQGWRHPLIVSNRSGLLVVGHGRLLAARKLNLPKVPVHYQDFLDDDQECAFLISDNAIASWAELDLSMVNSDIGEFDPSFDIDLLAIRNFVLDPSEFNADEHWQGMPDYNQEDMQGVQRIIVHFKTKDDVIRFSKLINQRLTDKTKYIWYPEKVEV